VNIGSLFSGAGGLDMAVEHVFGGNVVWHCEQDKAASTVLAHRWPNVPNLGDITTVDWTAVEPVDVLCGGFPCTDVSAAGKRAGIAEGTRSGLWSEMAVAIGVLRPSIVIIENVRGLLSARAHRNVELADTTLGDQSGRLVLRAAGAVLGDLADLGYDAQWTTVAAGDVGAPHRRERVFILATDTAVGRRDAWLTESEGLGWQPVTGTSGDRAGKVTLLPTPTAQAAKHAGDSRFGGGNGDVSNLWQIAHLLPLPCAQQSGCSPEDHLRKKPGRKVVTDLAILVENGLLESGGALLPMPRSQDAAGGKTSRSGGRIDEPLLGGQAREMATAWGKYEPAIRRWEALTRPAPAPTEPNKNGNPRLSAAFSEWLMGWPDGWVTDPAIGISRNDQLRIIGNGVCPQQAVAALKYLLNVCEVVA
jgi:DNA (cytosine-5)-methyltransferase 1